MQVGDIGGQEQLLARGITHIYFQANVWIFTFLVFLVGIPMGIGKAAVYRHIPDYFPEDVGVVGGIVGVIGRPGRFFLPDHLRLSLEARESGPPAGCSSGPVGDLHGLDATSVVRRMRATPAVLSWNRTHRIDAGQPRCVDVTGQCEIGDGRVNA